MEETEKYYFTFGSGQKHEGYCQPIFGDYWSARQKMIETYGNKWAFQYSQEEWNDMKKEPGRMFLYPLEKEMEAMDA